MGVASCEAGSGGGAGSSNWRAEQSDSMMAAKKIEIAMVRVVLGWSNEIQSFVLRIAIWGSQTASSCMERQAAASGRAERLVAAQVYR